MSLFRNREQTVKHGGDVKVSRFNLEIGGKKLIQNGDMTLTWGRRYGLVGFNGCGKTTLMKALAKVEGPFEGCLPEGMDVLLVQQEVPADERTALDTVIAADTELISLRDELAAIEAREDEKMSDEDREALDERLLYVHERLEEIGSDSADQRASAILTGLQFPEEEKLWPTKHFSGGWRMRIALAQALFRQPRLLLLDEPTNHLDLHAVIWLENYLSTWRNTLVVVSHDRDFLTNVATDILQIFQKKLNHYRGTYADFEKQFADKLAAHEKAYEAQQKKIKKLKAEGKLSKGATDGKGRETKGQKKQKEAMNKKDKKGKKSGRNKADMDDLMAGDDDDGLLEKITANKMSIKFREGGELPMPLIAIKEASFHYPKKEELFRNLDCGINMEDRIAIVGANGTGKSTLLKLMSGDLDPTKGEVELKRQLRIGVYSQHSSHHLDLDKNPCEYLMSKFPEVKYQEARNMLGRFGLPGELAVRKMSTLSGGEKARVVFVELGLQNCHILLLDEPTNHLDLETIDCLVDGLKEFEGGVVIVTHNMHLINEVCSEEDLGQLWVVGEDHEITTYDGSIEDYKDELEAEFLAREREEEAEALKRVEAKKTERERKLKEKEERIQKAKKRKEEAAAE